MPDFSAAPANSGLLFTSLQEAALPFALFHAADLSCVFASKGWLDQVCGTANPGASAASCFPEAAQPMAARLFETARKAGNSSSHTRDNTTPAAFHFQCQYQADSAFMVWAFPSVAPQEMDKDHAFYKEKLTQLEHVLNNMEEGVSISNAAGTIFYTNKAEDEMFGYAPGELNGLHVSIQNAYPSNENEALVAHVMEEVRNRGAWSGEWHNRRKDGTSFYTYSHITAAGQGKDLQFICVQRDITQEKETLEALQLETKLKNTITDNATATLFMMNAAGYCTFMNPAGEQMFGFSQEEIRSKPLHYLVHHHRPDGSFYPMQECPIDRALPENFDVRAHEDLFFRKDGSSLRVSCAASPIFENGIPVSTVIEVRDISREKEAQESLQRSAEELEQKVRERTAELEAANEQLKQFAYAASHDLQEPLRKIHFFSDRLKQSLGNQLPVGDRAMFDRMENAAQRMRTLIDDLLNYSHTSLGATTQAHVDLNILLREVLEDMEATILEQGAHIEAGPLPMVQGNARQLRQLLQNLLSNAIKYAQPGQPAVVRVSAAEKGSNGHKVYEIYVQDNGIGFEQADSERIFHVFQRLHGRSEYAGTGIGLAIVRKVAENHGGTITAQSQPGKGSTFTLCLPQAGS